MHIWLLSLSIVFLRFHPLCCLNFYLLALQDVTSTCNFQTAFTSICKYSTHIPHILPPPPFAHFLLLRVPFIPLGSFMSWEKARAEAGAPEGRMLPSGLLHLTSMPCLLIGPRNAGPRDGAAHCEPDPSTLIKKRTH